LQASQIYPRPPWGLLPLAKVHFFSDSVYPALAMEAQRAHFSRAKSQALALSNIQPTEEAVAPPEKHQ